MYPRSTPRRLVALLAGLCMACTVALGQSGKIKGRLLLDQTPIADETIVLKNAEGRICNGTLTDEWGVFSFPHVVPGTYTLVGKFKDYEAEVECTVLPNEEVHVALTCKKKRRQQGDLHREMGPAYT